MAMTMPVLIPATHGLFTPEKLIVQFSRLSAVSNLSKISPSITGRVSVKVSSDFQHEEVSGTLKSAQNATPFRQFGQF